MKLKDMPVVTVEQITRFRIDALEEIERVSAIAAMQAKVLKQAKLWIDAAYSIPPITPECISMICDIETALAESSDMLSAYKCAIQSEAIEKASEKFRPQHKYDILKACTVQALLLKMAQEIR